MLVNHGALVGQLQAAAGRDGKLPGVLELVEKDTGGKGVQRERVERGAVQLRGLRFLNITKAGTDPVSQAVKALRDFQSAMADPLVQVQSGELRAKRAEIQRHLRQAVELAEMVAAAVIFFERGQLIELGRWTQRAIEMNGTSYSASRNGLVRLGDRLEIRLPPTIRRPPMPTIRLLVPTR